jgi:hypothetical protein
VVAEILHFEDFEVLSKKDCWPVGWDLLQTETCQISVKLKFNYGPCVVKTKLLLMTPLLYNFLILGSFN